MLVKFFFSKQGRQLLDAGVRAKSGRAKPIGPRSVHLTATDAPPAITVHPDPNTADTGYLVDEIPLVLNFVHFLVSLNRVTVKLNFWSKHH